MKLSFFVKGGFQKEKVVKFEKPSTGMAMLNIQKAWKKVCVNNRHSADTFANAPISSNL